MTKFISIEGGDCVGKTTTVRALEEKLRNEGCKVKSLHFPRYDKPIGTVIKQALNKEIDIEHLALQHLYIADQVAYSINEKTIENEEYDYVIYDRYNLSTKVYILADWLKKFRPNNKVFANNLTEKMFFQGLLKGIEQAQAFISEPDIQIILHLEEYELLRRLDLKTKDKFEENTEFMKIINNLYKDAQKLNLIPADKSFTFNVTNLSVEEITNKIYDIIV